MLLRSISLLALAATLGASTPLAAQNAAQGALLARALDAAAAGDWVDAKTFAADAGNPVADDLVLWVRLRDGAGNWDEYGDFLARHPDWPGLAALRRSGERQMPSGQPPETVLAFFDGRPPETGTGALRLAEALSTAGREAEAEAEIVRAWTTFSMTPAERKAHGRPLEGRPRRAPRGADGHAALARADQRGRGDDDPRLRRLAEARRGAHRHPPRRRGPAVRHQPGAAGAPQRSRPRLRALPLPGEEGPLAGGRGLPARALALGRRPSAGPTCGWSAAPTSPARPSPTGRSTEAYAIAAKSFGTAGGDYADAEWVAGFIALTRLDDPEGGGRALPPLPGGGRDADQPRPRRLLDRRRLRGGRRRRRGGGGLPRGREVPDELLRPARRREGRPARRPRARRQRRAARLARRADGALLAGRGGLFPPRRRRRRPRLAVLPPGGGRPAGRRCAPRSPRWRSTSAGPRSASASARTRPATGSSSPTSIIRCTRSPSATGGCRPNTPWRSPGRSPSSTPARRAAPAPAA